MLSHTHTNISIRARAHARTHSHKHTITIIPHSNPLLQQWNTSLCELSLSRNELKANGARALAPVMPINLRGRGSSLQVRWRLRCTLASRCALASGFLLQLCCISDIGCSLIFYARGLSVRLQCSELNLNFNSLGEEGASALAPALSKMNSLKHLKLFGNLVGHEGAQVFRLLLHRTPLCLAADCFARR